MKDYIIPIIKVIVVNVLITIISVLLLSFLLYKFNLGEKTITTAIAIIYGISNFAGGFIIGKLKENKKYMWGMMTGLTYFIMLSIVSFIATGELYGDGTQTVTALAACIFGGAVGGMLS